ncbi:MAG: glycoside hydrolase family 2 TIM barrel-domain containing protein [Eubacteriales bacterium]|nr:glycoside hydrolase family 2 TIM barrel-domain containing protein [Eubacteriales bacterium]
MKRIELSDGWRLQAPSGFLDGFGTDSGGVSVTVPHDAMADTPRSPQSPNGAAGGWYMGDTWTYVRALRAEADWLQKPVLLALEGVSTNAAVFVNGQFAGKCPSPYACLTVSIGELLREGDNELKVVARCGMQRTSRWYVGGGMLRPAALLLGDDVCIPPAGVRVTTLEADETQAVVKTEITVRHSGLGQARARLRQRLLSPDGAVCAQDEQPLTLLNACETTALCRLCVQAPALWSVESPSLCTLEVELAAGERIVERQQVPCGIRTLSVDAARGLRINGQNVKLRGACIHHDNGMLGGVSLPDAELRRVKRLKEAGFNAIRSAHNPASSALLAACDRVGMLVMDELFDAWNISKADHDSSLTFAEWWPTEMQAMVDKDYNHPSVILYTVGNEIPETGAPAGAALNRTLALRLRRLDGTRPVVNCINGMFSVMPRMRELLADVVGDAQAVPSDINAMMTMFDAHIDQLMRHDVVTQATEETFAGADVCGYNYMDSRYEQDAARYPNRVIVGSESTPSSIGRTWRRILRCPHVLGDFTWTGWEYLGEAGVGKNDYDMTHAMYGAWPWYLAYCGDFDLCGNRRPQSYYREIVYGLRKAPYLAAERPEHYGQPRCTTNWTWSDVVESWTWHGWEGKPIHVEAYGDGDEAALLLDGREIARAKIGEQTPYKALFDLRYQPGTLCCVLYQKGKELARTSLCTAGSPAKLLLVPEETEKPADGCSLIHVNVLVADAQDRVVPCADRSVHVQAEGAACEARVASADPTSTKAFLDPDCVTFDGRALIILRMGHESGEIALRVTAQGLEDAAVTLHATR